MTTAETAQRWAMESAIRTNALQYPRMLASVRRHKNQDRMRLALDRKAGPELCFEVDPAEGGS